MRRIRLRLASLNYVVPQMNALLLAIDEKFIAADGNLCCAIESVAAYKYVNQ